jgi:hypothetical protein
MAAALIKFTQGATTDLAGRAVEGALSAAVVASNADNTGVTSWAWYLIDAPAGSGLTITEINLDSRNPIGSPAATTSTFTFTPDVSGTYEVMLIANGVRAIFDVRDFVVAEPSGHRIPALRSDPSTYNLGGQTRGPRADVNAILKQAAAGASGGVTRRTTAGPVSIPTTPTRQEYSSCYAGAITWNFPDTSGLAAGFFIRIKDGLVQASTNNITVHPHGTDTIDGVSGDFVMAIDGESYDFEWDGVTWCLV